MTNVRVVELAVAPNGKVEQEREREKIKGKSVSLRRQWRCTQERLN